MECFGLNVDARAESYLWCWQRAGEEMRGRSTVGGVKISTSDQRERERTAEHTIQYLSIATSESYYTTFTDESPSASVRHLTAFAAFFF